MRRQAAGGWGWGALALLVMAGCERSERQDPSAARPAAPAAASAVEGGAPTAAPTRAHLAGVSLRLLPGATLEIRELVGRLVPTGDAIPYFDEPATFALEIEDAVLSMSGPSLSAVLDDCLKRHDEVPLRDVAVVVEDDELRQSGKLEAGLRIPFEIAARPEVAAGGRQLALRPTAVEAAHLPVRGLLDLLDLEMDEMLELDGTCGLAVEGNTLLFDPSMVGPPPRLRGRMRAVEVVGDRLELRFGRGGGEPPPGGGNFMDFQGGRLRFGKLTMLPTDLRLIDVDPDDPFDFYLSRYNDHLVAGYTLATPAGGLRVHMPDYGDIGGRPVDPPPVAPRGAP